LPTIMMIKMSKPNQFLTGKKTPRTRMARKTWPLVTPAIIGRRKNSSTRRIASSICLSYLRVKEDHGPDDPFLCGARSVEEEEVLKERGDVGGKFAHGDRREVSPKDEQSGEADAAKLRGETVGAYAAKVSRGTANGTANGAADAAAAVAAGCSAWKPTEKGVKVVDIDAIILVIAEG